MRFNDFEINPFMYAGSTIGNAAFSGLDIHQLFSCVRLAKNVEEFDAAASATIRLMEMIGRKK